MALSWKLDPFAMIPYWPPFYVRLGPFTISPPIALACAGILVAHFLLLRRVGRQGLDRETAAMMSLVMVVAGAFGAYWFRGVYQADAVKRDWHTLLQFQYGAASFGGLAFGLLAGWVYLAFRRLPPGHASRYLDALAFVFPTGWIIGRAGCILAHDHPGIRTESFFGVRYPGGTRFDLAVIEVLFLALVMLPLFAFLDRRPRAGGFWLGAFLTVYGGFRLWLDTLHVDPPRYGPFSVDQWAYGSVLLLGLTLLTRWKQTNSVK